MIRPLTMVALLAAMVAAQAQSSTVWRCGADGRSYADAPCPGGQQVAVADPRSPADVAAARAVVERDWRLAQRLAAERRVSEREALARRSGLAGIGPAQQLKPKAATPSATHRPSSKRRPTEPKSGSYPVAGRPGGGLDGPMTGAIRLLM